jgi:AraC family transcriptional regulator, regulatory protein of adaptative response / methylated-DNA-[protein]-cysteine methyltransferase
MTMNLPHASTHIPLPSEHGITFAFATTSLGEVLVAATDRGVCAILIGSRRDRLIAELKQDFPEARLAQVEQLADVIAGVVDLIEKPSRPLKSGVDLHGSDFEIKVWRALQTIPPGQTLSYSALADRIGLKGVAKTAKDIADACASNKIAVAVPCHRVLRKDGTISGYRWGVHRKRALLEREGVQ